MNVVNIPAHIVEAVRIELARELSNEYGFHARIGDIEVSALRNIVRRMLVAYESAKRQSPDDGPWWCGDCGSVVAGKTAPCPNCGPVRTS